MSLTVKQKRFVFIILFILVVFKALAFKTPKIKLSVSVRTMCPLSQLVPGRKAQEKNGFVIKQSHFKEFRLVLFFSSGFCPGFYLNVAT